MELADRGFACEKVRKLEDKNSARLEALIVDRGILVILIVTGVGMYYTAWDFHGAYGAYGAYGTMLMLVFRSVSGEYYCRF